MPHQAGSSRDLLKLIADGGLGASLEAEYNATPPVLADEDASPLQLNSSGDLKVEITNTGVANADGNPLYVKIASTSPLIAGTALIGHVDGSVAHDAADTNNPLKIGGIARATLSGETLVTAADRVNANFGLDGSQFVRTVPLGDIVSGSASNTDGTVTTVIASAGAGLKQYLSRVSLSNAHATTGAMVELLSGAVVRWAVFVPPGGREISFDPPLAPNAANETWRFDPGAAVTTLYCSMNGFKSKI